MKEVHITTEFITLVQLLKLEAVISSGGEITSFLHHNDVYYNGELENRKRKKLYVGDVVQVNDDVIFKIC